MTKKMSEEDFEKSLSEELSEEEFEQQLSSPETEINDPQLALEEKPQIEKTLSGRAKALIRGGGQGIFGFGDEIEGALFAAKELANKENRTISLKDIVSEYKKQRDVAREKTSKAQEEYPEEFYTGAIGTGVASTVALPVASTVKGAVGAGLGLAGLTAVGQAPEIENIPKQVSETLTDPTVLGLSALPVVPTAIKTIGKGLKAGAKMVESLPAVKTTTRSFEKGLEGKQVFGEKSQLKSDLNLARTSRKLAKDLEAGQKQAGSEMRGALEAAEKSGKTLDLKGIRDELETSINKLPTGLSEELADISRLKGLLDHSKNLNNTLSVEELEKMLSPNFIRKLQHTIAKGPKGEDAVKKMIDNQIAQISPLLTPTQVQQIKESFVSLSHLGQSPLTYSRSQAIATAGSQKVGDVLKESIKDYAPASDKYFAHSEAMRNLKLSPGLSEQEALSKAGTFLDQLSSKGLTRLKASESVKDFMGNLRKASPELSQKLGPKIRDIAEERGLLRETGRASFSDLLGTVKGKVAMGANIAGLSINKFSKMAPERLKEVANSVSSLGQKGAKLANVLNSMSGSNQTKRNAILFAVMQDPEYREMLDATTLGTDEEEMLPVEE